MQQQPGMPALEISGNKKPMKDTQRANGEGGDVEKTASRGRSVVSGARERWGSVGTEDAALGW